MTPRSPWSMGRKISFPRLGRKLSASAMMRTDCLGRKSGRPRPADQARPLADWRGKVKALALVRAKRGARAMTGSAGNFDHFACIINRRTRAAGAAARGRGFGFVGSGAGLTPCICICIVADAVIALNRDRRRQNGRIKPWPIPATAVLEVIGSVFRWAGYARAAVLAAGAQSAGGTGFADKRVFGRLERRGALIG